MRRSRASPSRIRRRTPCSTTPVELMFVTMAGEVNAWPNASTPQTLTGSCTQTLAVRRRSMNPPVKTGVILAERGDSATLRGLSQAGYQSLRGKPRQTPLSVEIGPGAGARAARISATAAGAGCRGGGCGFCRDGENGQLRRQLHAVAFRALGLGISVHQRFEVMLAFLADVFEDRHECLPRFLAYFLLT